MAPLVTSFQALADIIRGQKVRGSQAVGEDQAAWPAHICWPSLLPAPDTGLGTAPAPSCQGPTPHRRCPPPTGSDAGGFHTHISPPSVPKPVPIPGNEQRAVTGQTQPPGRRQNAPVWLHLGASPAFGRQLCHGRPPRLGARPAARRAGISGVVRRHSRQGATGGGARRQARRTSSA